MPGISKSTHNSDSMTIKALGLLPSYLSYRHYYRLLKRSQYWGKDQLEEYQMKELGKLLRHAYENVPYYKKIFDERKLTPADIRDLSDLKKLPFLTKELVCNNLEDLKARNYSGSRFEYVTTGGSSGIPMGFYYEKGVSRAIEWAFMKTQWERVGYSFLDKCVILKGGVINSKDNRLWKKTFFGRWLVLSSYHMTDDNLASYVEKIRTFKPRYIQAYPSTATILARYIKKNRLKPFPTVKAIFCASENMYPDQESLLSEIFQCRIYSWYGHSERAILAGECEYSDNLHVFPEYGIFELVNEDGTPIKKEGQPGIPVGTCLTNYAMPLIRYKTDDLGTYTDENCTCHRNYRLLKNVEGRWLQEFIVARSNRLIPITAINMHSDIFDNVHQFQFYQEREGEVILNLVRKRNYSVNDTENIKKELLAKMGDDVFLKINFVEAIPRTNRGKYNFLIQKLSINMDSLKIEPGDPIG